jgi:uncharacterized zinc-type alcohol dehydrogenase-like protein
MVQSYGYAAHAQGAALVPFAFERREPRPHDVIVDIAYCGVCHSDVHYVDNDNGISAFPVVPGHEAVGQVRWVGDAVTKFKVGDRAAVGCYVDSCRICHPCRSDHQQMCVEGLTGTFASVEREGGRPTWGGFSNNYVADEAYVHRVPTQLDPAAAAPLLCAGITTWSPLRKWKVGPGSKVGVIGLGGLGHMAVKLAIALGAEVAVFTTSERKSADAKALGAADAILSTDAQQMMRHAGRFDFILDTVSVRHELGGYLNCLRPDATLCLVGLPSGSLEVSPLSLVFGQRSITGSLIGGLNETQEMLDFCGARGVTAEIELLPAKRINEAYDRLRRNDVRYRFVLDMAGMERPS